MRINNLKSERRYRIFLSLTVIYLLCSGLQILLPWLPKVPFLNENEGSIGLTLVVLSWAFKLAVGASAFELIKSVKPWPVWKCLPFLVVGFVPVIPLIMAFVFRDMIKGNPNKIPSHLTTNQSPVINENIPYRVLAALFFSYFAFFIALRIDRPVFNSSSHNNDGRHVFFALLVLVLSLIPAFWQSGLSFGKRVLIGSGVGLVLVVSCFLILLLMAFGSAGG